ITFVESPEALHPDLRVMDEHVRATLTGEETETLGLVEPLDSAFDHYSTGPPGPWALVVSVICERSRTEGPPDAGGSLANARTTATMQSRMVARGLAIFEPGGVSGSAFSRSRASAPAR